MFKTKLSGHKKI